MTDKELAVELRSSRERHADQSIHVDNDPNPAQDWTPEELSEGAVSWL